MNLSTTSATLLQRTSCLFKLRVYFCFSLFLLCFGAGKALAQSTDSPSLAETLARAPQTAGAAPEKYSTPFLITRVVPKGSGSDTCYVEAVTNGMSYDLFADGLIACHHLPDFHAIQWGRRPDRLVEGSVELVYTAPGEKVKTAKYIIRRTVVIHADWTEDQ